MTQADINSQIRAAVDSFVQELTGLVRRAAIDSVSAANDDSKGRRRSPVEEIQGSIRAAGFEPVERDGRFERRR